ncbi:MAG: hypothetical protein OEQ53_19210 [Saprospiraceae bacterium]|nr:hypothetical protein [Saprospiraceae bacterium]
MIISDKRKITEIQEAFQHQYPYLKLEFYRKGHEAAEGSYAKDQHDSDASISEIRTKHNEGDLQIKPNMTVAEMESVFEKKYGLHVQVFRQSGDLWLQTTSTDTWTLEEQNLHGQRSREKMKETDQEEVSRDYREQP